MAMVLSIATNLEYHSVCVLEKKNSVLSDYHHYTNHRCRSINSRSRGIEYLNFADDTDDK